MMNAEFQCFIYVLDDLMTYAISCDKVTSCLCYVFLFCFLILFNLTLFFINVTSEKQDEITKTGKGGGFKSGIKSNLLSRPHKYYLAGHWKRAHSYKLRFWILAVR